jgi:hypothetical protein
MRKIIKVHHINVQCYWNATLVGPGVWRFLTAYAAILEALAANISASKGVAAAAEFIATHRRGLELLQVVSHFTRTTYMLSALELKTLGHARLSFGEALRLSYPKQTLTVKGF